MKRLLPESGETSVAEELSALHFGEHAHEERPYTVTNFALTLDGQATIGGRSGKIGSRDDTAMLVGLRASVDAVLVGAGTMRVERYGRMLPNQHDRARRERLGLPHDPLAVIASNSLQLPWDAGLFASGVGRVLIVTASEDPVPETATPLRVLRQPGGTDLTEMMRFLRRERGVRSVLCEGGPMLHAELIADGLVDELFVTHAAKLAGGDGFGLVRGLPAGERPLEVGWLLHEPKTDELFGRYLFRL